MVKAPRKAPPCLSAFTIVLLVVALLAAPRSAHAQSVAGNSCGAADTATSLYLAVVMNGECVNLSGQISAGQKPGTAQAGTGLTIGDQGFAINAFWDADPFITFTFTSTNIGSAPVIYEVLFSTPVVPALYSYAEATLTGSVMTAGGGVVNTAGKPTFLTGLGSNGGASTNLGVGIGTGPCVAPTTTCGNATASNTFAPISFNTLSATLAFTQTGLGSSVTFSGRIDLFESPPLTSVPEPSTYALMAFGLAALAVARRRRGVVR